MKKFTTKPRGKRKDGRIPKKQSAPLKLPILCRPGAEMSSALYIVGWIMRSLVLFCGVMGLVLFIGDGFGFYGTDGEASIPVLTLVSLFLTAVCSAAAWNSRTAVIVPPSAFLIGISFLFIFSSNPFLLIWDGIRCVINSAMLHMADLGYTSFASNLIGSQSYTCSLSVVMNVGCAVLASFFAVILAISLLRRVHTVLAVLVSFTVIFPVFMYNLTEDNAGISLVLIFIFGELSLLFYERKFSNYEEKKLEKCTKKAEKKLAAKEKRAKKKAEKAALDRAAAKAYAIAIELTDDKKEARRSKASVYRIDAERRLAEKKAEKKANKEKLRAVKLQKKADKKAAATEKRKLKAAASEERADFKKLPSDEKKRRLEMMEADKRAKKAALAEKRRLRAESETVTRKTLSASGYAGGTAVIAAALAVWLPFSAVSGKFMTIGFINDPVSVAREYVTAYLKGDDIDLNKMGSIEELTPRTLTYDSPKYNKVQMLAVETEKNYPVYLRGWIGMRFDTETGTWTSGTSDDVVEYRNTFGKAFTPDSLKTEILGTLLPTAVENISPNISLRFSDLGVDVRHINLRRINGESRIVYLPPTMNSELGILEYNSTEPNAAKYSSYFDSIYSSRFFDDTVQYSTVSFTTALNDTDVGTGLSAAGKYYELYSDFIEIYESAIRVLETENRTDKRIYDTGKGKALISKTDYSDLDRLFIEEAEKIGYRIQFEESLLGKFMSMTPEERTAEKEKVSSFLETEAGYREWAYLHYGGSTYSSTVSEIAETLLEDAGYIRNTRVNGNTPLYENSRGDDINEHDVVMTAINHLRDGYTYTLEPTPYTGDAPMSVLDSFLAETKNGYCTHFATAAAALIREFGYSVRYCEGYLVNDFYPDYSDNAPSAYKGFALDENAHAWIEVYYPMIGWIAYETTPAYAGTMYDSFVSDTGTGGNSSVPNLPAEERPIPDPEDPPSEEEEEAEITDDLSETDETEEEPVDQMLILMIIGIAVIAAAILFAVFKLIIRRIVKKAESAVADRHRHIVIAMDAELLANGKIDTLSIAKEFDDTVLRIFDLLGYPPRTGEQYSEYAARLECDFGGMTDYSLPQIFDLIAKVEFGGGLSPEEMYILADFTDRLTVSAYAGLTRFERIKYRYIKRII